MKDIQNLPISPTNGRYKYLAWILVNALGFGFALPVAFITAVPVSVIEEIFIRFIPGQQLEGWIVMISQTIIIAIFIGFCQWIILGNHRIALLMWLLVNGIGLSVPLGIFYAGYENLIQPLGLWTGIFIYGFLTGSIIGFTQWLLMRRLNSRSQWWIFANILGYIGGLAITGLVYVTISNLGDDLLTGLSLYCLVPLLGIVTSVISGIGLLWPIKWFESS